MVASDHIAFSNKYPGVANVVSGFLPPVHNHVQLADSAGQVVNEVTFSNDGDWAARILTTNGFSAYGHWGWEWSAPFDGGGSSLELINSALPNTYALNWGASALPGGTPGRANSIARTNAAPLITSVSHSPVIPQPTDIVLVTARLIDEQRMAFPLPCSIAMPAPRIHLLLARYQCSTTGRIMTGWRTMVFSPLCSRPKRKGRLSNSISKHRTWTAIASLPECCGAHEFAPDGELVVPGRFQALRGAQPLYRLIMTEMERLEIYQLGRGCPAPVREHRWIAMPR